MTWLKALKEWNAKKGGKYTIPKKGSPEYDAVKKIQSKSEKKSSSDSSSDSSAKGV